MVDILVIMSRLVENDLIAGIVALVGWIYVLGKTGGVLAYVARGFIMIGGSIKKVIALTLHWTTSLWQAVAAMTALAVTMAAVTFGVSAIAGSLATVGSGVDEYGKGANGPKRPSGKSSNVYNDNRSYTINNHGERSYGDERRDMKKMDSWNKREQMQKPKFEKSGN